MSDYEPEEPVNPEPCRTCRRTEACDKCVAVERDDGSWVIMTTGAFAAWFQWWITLSHDWWLGDKSRDLEQFRREKEEQAE